MVLVYPKGRVPVTARRAPAGRRGRTPRSGAQRPDPLVFDAWGGGYPGAGFPSGSFR